MARLVLDFEVKNEKKAEQAVRGITNEAEKAKKKFETLTANSGFTKLATNAEKVVIPLKRITQEATDLGKTLKNLNANSGFQDITVHAKTLLNLESQLNDEIENQARLQAKIVAATKQGSIAQRSLANQIVLQKEKTKELAKEAYQLGIIDSATRDLHKRQIDAQRSLSAMLKAQKADRASYYSDQEKSSKESLNKQAAYWNRFYREQAANQKKAQAEQANYWNSYNKYLEAARRKTADYWNAFIKWQKKAEGGTGSNLFGSIKSSFIGGAVAGLSAGLILKLQSAISSVTSSIIELGKEGVRSFFKINTEVEQTKILLGTALGDDKLGDKMFGNILDMAEKMPFSIQAISDSFVKLQTAGIDRATEMVTALADSISAFGGSDDDLHLATIAIQQMAGKGVVSMEELRRQLGERVPDVIRNLAKQMKMSYYDLVDTVSKGQLFFDENTQSALFDALNQHAGAAEKRMNSMVGSMARLRNSWTKLMVDIGESNGLFKTMADVVETVAQSLTEFSRSEEGKKLIDDLTESAKKFIEMFKNPEIVRKFFIVVQKVVKITIDLILLLVDTVVAMIDKFSGANNIFKNTAVTSGTKGRNKNTVIEPTVTQKLKLDWQDYKASLEAAKEGMTDLGKEVDKVSSKRIRGSGNGLVNLNAEIRESSRMIEDYAAKLTELDDTEFDIRLKLMTDDQANSTILATVDELKRKAIEAGNGSLAGYENQVSLLEKAKKLLEDMNLEGRKVTAQEVESARQRWEYQQRITQNGKSAYGWAAKDYNEAREAYLKLSEAYRTGEKLVDENSVSKQKSLLNELYRIQLEGIQKVREESEKVQERDSALQRLKEAKDENYKIVDTNKAVSDSVDNTRKSWIKYGDKVIYINNEIAKATENTNSVKLPEGVEEVEKGLVKYQGKLVTFSKVAEKALSTPNDSLKETDTRVEETQRAWIKYGDKVIELSQKSKESIDETNAALEKQIELLSKTRNYSSTSNSSSLEGREFGGPVRAGTPYIVGEKRPEIFVPNVNGYIVPNMNSNNSSNLTRVEFTLGGQTAEIKADELNLRKLRKMSKDIERYHS